MLPSNTAGPMARRKGLMTSVEECRANAAEYKKLADDPKNSPPPIHRAEEHLA
jgi:hypothetical protein